MVNSGIRQYVTQKLVSGQGNVQITMLFPTRPCQWSVKNWHLCPSWGHPTDSK